MSGSPQVRECRGVIHYSESQIYMAYLDFSTTSERPRWLAEQTEAIVSDHWVVSTNHQFPSQTVAVSSPEDPQFVSTASIHRIQSDPTLLFQQRIVDFATQDFAKPRLNANGQLVVRHSSGQALKEPGALVSPRVRMFDVIFSGDSEMRPTSNRLLKLHADGQIQELGFFDVRYGLTTAGKTVIRSIASEARGEEQNAIPEIYDFWIREIDCPAWNTTPPRISISSNSITVRQHGVDGQQLPDTHELPAEVEGLFRRIETREFKQLLDDQKKTLDSMDAFVRAEVVPAEPTPAFETAPQEAHTFPSASVVATVLGTIIMVLTGLWIVLWKRTYSRRP